MYGAHLCFDCVCSDFHNADTDFTALGAGNSVWNVCRADFDEILLDHAREQGAFVFQRTKVTSITFDENERPVSAIYTALTDPSTLASSSYHIFDNQHTISFDYLIDATGRTGLLSSRYLKTRKYNNALRNAATWGYWRGAGIYGRGTSAEGAPWFEALTGPAFVLPCGLFN
jgi:flavin-dependent dehydrogenase